MKKVIEVSRNLQGSCLYLSDLEEYIVLFKLAENPDSCYITADYNGCLTAYSNRLETDEEYYKRLTKEKKESEKRAQSIIKKRDKQRALYEKLKAKFEDEL